MKTVVITSGKHTGEIYDVNVHGVRTAENYFEVQTLRQFEDWEHLCVTQQNQKDDADINTMIKKYGIESLLQQPPGIYGDFTDPVLRDYGAALDIVNNAKQAFEALPEKLKKHFDNDPSKLLQGIDKLTEDEMKYLGLKVGSTDSSESVSKPAAGDTATSV